jgi:hypothetical protein
MKNWITLARHRRLGRIPGKEAHSCQTTMIIDVNQTTNFWFPRSPPSSRNIGGENRGWVVFIPTGPVFLQCWEICSPITIGGRNAEPSPRESMLPTCRIRRGKCPTNPHLCKMPGRRGDWANQVPHGCLRHALVVGDTRLRPFPRPRIWGNLRNHGRLARSVNGTNKPLEFSVARHCRGSLVVLESSPCCRENVNHVRVLCNRNSGLDPCPWSVSIAK